MQQSNPFPPTTNSNINEVNELMHDALTTLNQYNYNPDLNNKKVLLLVAAHINCDLKKESIKSILKYFHYECIDIVIANSTNLEMQEMQEYYASNNARYYEIENQPTLDFGKWFFLLNAVNYTMYDDVIFINDSIILKNKLNHFINLIINNDFELYGYNNSTEINYHYQSYLFSIKPMHIYKFMNMFLANKDKINTQDDVINEYELKMPNYFKTHSCFLKTGNLSINKEKNIHFKNDDLFNELYNLRLLPFIKIKRLNFNYIPLHTLNFILTCITNNKMGVEIGGPSFYTGSIIYKNALNMDNVIFSSTTVWSNHTPEYNYYSGKTGNSVNISNVDNKTYDFVFGSHCLEHIANPLKAIYEWLRIVKDGGFIIMILPEKSQCFDHKRSVSSFSTLLSQYNKNVGEDDLSTLSEILENHDLSMDPPAGDLHNFTRRSLDNYNNRCLHHYVYSPDLLKEICEFVNCQFIYTFTEGINIWFVMQKI